MDADQESIFVHVGSGRQYAESLNLAVINGSAYIQAATEKNIKMPPPSGKQIRYITAPNLDLNIIKLFHWLKSARGLFLGEEVTFTESHQEEKNSRPGTALKFCNILNLPKEGIISIRNPEMQKKLHINNLKQHAFHKIQIGDENSKITIETKIEGATSYVKGLAQIIACIPELAKGNYEVEELIALKLL